MQPRYTEIKEHVLGKRYDLSLAFLPPAKMRAVTRQTKHKDKASNVLAFPLSPASGEILICKETARRECKDFGMRPGPFVDFLFIHGCLHLKGLAHGATMEREERRIMKRFGVGAHEQAQNSNRH